MSTNSQYNKDDIAEYSEFIKKGEGGIFTRKTRQRLTGVLGLSGRNRTKNDFWYDQREKVKRALIDLELFIRCADKDQVNQVLTRDTLLPIVVWLFMKPTVAEPDVIRSDIADLFIHNSFSYLRNQIPHMTLSHDRTIREATDLSTYFLLTISKGEKGFFR